MFDKLAAGIVSAHSPFLGIYTTMRYINVSVSNLCLALRMAVLTCSQTS